MKKHLTSFKVTNFKKFREISLFDIGQFNLIVGDNSSGKTTLLESLLFDSDEPIKNISNLYYALSHRSVDVNVEKINFIREYYLHEKNKERLTYEYQTTLDDKQERFDVELKHIDKLDEEQLTFLRSNRVLFPSFKDFAIFKDGNNSILDIVSVNDSKSINDDANSYFNFIPFHIGYQGDLIEFYSKHIQSSRSEKEKFIQSLKVIMPDIEDIDITQRSELDNIAILVVWQKNLESPLPLSMMGEGFIRLFRILCEITMCKDARLMIDEIDSGIHYSRFEFFIGSIIEMAKLYNVQIFATTHSLECLSYFTAYIEKNDLVSNRARIFSLVKNSNGDLSSINYKFEQFKYSLKNDLEIRGGEL